ncbi:MAG: FIST C-terminal domain-containing protein [Alphaproteobacteria bacterium]|nr:FIST C-terminal domain-containing protein [Alphaproteobacteria bacterium]
MPKAPLLRGGSQAPNPREAVAELHRAIGGPRTAFAVIFFSPQYDVNAIAAAVRERFGDTPVFGCTTAGEITPFGYISGGLCGIGFPADEFAVTSVLFEDLSNFEVASTLEKTRLAVADQARTAASAFPDIVGTKCFALLLVDGLSVREEQLVSAIANALGDMPLVGGSAGDDMNFRRTWILHGGRCVPNAASLLLVTARRRFLAFKTEHFLNTDKKMVVTGAKPAERIVTELNAEPAAREYARVIGVDGERLTPMTFAAHPVLVRVAGQYHVRAIQKVNPDDSLTFFCAIEEGLVLTVAKSVDVVHDLEDLFQRIQRELGEPDLIIGCDCVLRNVEIEQRQLKRTVSELFVRNGVIGFCTYGEQFNSMHVSQTFTGIAIGAA